MGCRSRRCVFVTAPLARLLITTRNNEVLVGLGAEEHRVEVLSPSDALKMLAEWVGQKSPDKLPPEAAESGEGMWLSAIGSGNDRRDDSLAAHGVEGRPRPPAAR